MTDPFDSLLRRTLEAAAADAADPAGQMGDLRRRAGTIRRRRAAAVTLSLVVLATAGTVSTSALTGLLPAPGGTAPPAVLTPADSRPTGSTRPAPPSVPTTRPTGTTPSPSAPDPARGLPAVPAVPAAAVLDTIGVTAHLDGDGGGNSGGVVRRLLDAGIRHVRTHALPLYSDRARCDDPFLLRRRALTDAGIRLTLTVGLSANLAELRPTIECLGGPGAIAAIEGQNEPDRYVAGDWVRQTRAGQQALHRAVKGDPRLVGIPVLAPTPSTSDALGSVAQYADLANAHPFQASSGQLGPALRRARAVAPGRPVVVTDLGWSNATAAPAARSVAVPTPEQEVADRLPRQLLDNAQRGIRRTYVYSLADDRDDPGRTDLEASFGLLRHDGTPKPAYEALATLTATLAGPRGTRPTASPGTLAHRLEGNTVGLGQLLIRRPDGSFVLALWGPGDDRALTLTLAAPARTRIVEPGGPAPPPATHPTRRLDLRIADRLLLVEIDP